ncbi:MAG: DUF202 domain-containing protein [Thermodesulfobacteriota bacterium]
MAKLFKEDPSDWDKVNLEEPLVRDFMAIERTIMANERTFLSFWRTALTLFIAGLTFSQFFDQMFFKVLGWLFIPTGLLVFLYGVRLYRKMNRIIQRAEQTCQLGEK